MGGIRLEWICVGYVRCAGYVWDMCGGYVWNGYVWDMCDVLDMYEIRKQSSEEPCDETSFGKNRFMKAKKNLIQNCGWAMRVGSATECCRHRVISALSLQQ